MWQDEVNLRSDWLPKQAHLEYQVGLRRKSSLSGRITNPLLSKLNRSRWLDIGLVPFCVFIIGLPVAKPDKVLSRWKKDNIKVARLDFLVGILPHFQRLLTRNKQR